MSTASSQSTDTSKARFDISFGWNFGGPSPRLFDHMEQNQFDEFTVHTHTTTFWFIFIWHTSTETTIDRNYPRYTSSGSFSLQARYSHRVFKRNFIGLIGQYSVFRKVTGARERGGQLNVQLKSYSIVPFWDYDPIDFISLQAGPAFNINRARKVGGGEDYTQFAPGFMLGSSIRVFQQDYTYIKLEANYYFMKKVSTGPFKVEDGGYEAILPAADHSYSFFKIGLVLGTYW